MKYIDGNGLLYITQKIKTWDANKVDKVEGKGLSENDFTTALKTDLENLKSNIAGYQTAAEVESAINTAVGRLTSFDFSIVESLPAEGQKGIIYLLKDAEQTTGVNVYNEYIWLNDKYEKIGSTETNLKNYVKTTDALTNEEIDAIISAAGA